MLRAFRKGRNARFPHELLFWPTSLADTCPTHVLCCLPTASSCAQTAIFCHKNTPPSLPPPTLSTRHTPHRLRLSTTVPLFFSATLPRAGPSKLVDIFHNCLKDFTTVLLLRPSTVAKQLRTTLDPYPHPSAPPFLFISSVGYPAPALPTFKSLPKYIFPNSRPSTSSLSYSANMNPSLLPGIHELLPGTEVMHFTDPPSHPASSHHRSDSCYKMFHSRRSTSHSSKTNSSHFSSCGRGQPNAPLPSVNELLKGLHDSSFTSMDTIPQSPCSSGSRSHQQRRSTATSSQKNQKKTTYSCPLCSRTFTRKSDAGKHQRVVHDKLIDSKCFVCHRQFTRKDYCAVRDHLTQHDFSIRCLTDSKFCSLLLFIA